MIFEAGLSLFEAGEWIFETGECQQAQALIVVKFCLVDC